MQEGRNELRGLSVLVVLLMLIVVPTVGLAFPFGGQTQVHHYCYNAAIYAYLSPPRGGPYIWTPSTKTYQFGPPRGVGQWLLGLTGPPYYCVVTRSPIFVKEGMSIMMMGSSGAAAPSYRPPPPGGGLFPPGGGGGTGGGGGAGSTPPTPGPTSIGHVVISEVFAYVDAAHGADPLNEWVEIYNGGPDSVSLSGWTISDASSTDTLPPGVTLAPGKLLIIAATSTTATFWNIPSGTTIVSLNSSIGNGLSSTGDALFLRQGSTTVDAVSWGTNTSAFNPSTPAPTQGNVLGRTSFSQDTNTAQDWVVRSPNPGQ